MTTADLVRALADHGVSLTINLKVDAAKAPPEDLLAEVRDRKPEVVAHLLGLDPDPSAIDHAEVAMFRTRNGPRGSWLIGQGLLARRLAHTTDPAVKARLERLIRITPVKESDYTLVEQRTNEVLAALEAEGKLPPA